MNAMVSGVGLIPYLGDFAKMFRDEESLQDS